MIRRLPASNPGPVSHARRGALFNYYMIYLMMTASIMAAAGVCLHTMLRADYADGQIGRQLQTVLRMERQLRLDASNAASFRIVDGGIVCQMPRASDGAEESANVTWTADRHLMLRTDSLEGRSERYIFDFGSRVLILPPRESIATTLLVVRIEEPSPHAAVQDSSVRRNQSVPETKKATDPISAARSGDSTQRHAVEILLPVRSETEVTP